MRIDLDKYELIEQKHLEELQAEGYLLRHKKSQARVLVVSNDDENKVFSIGFRTPPTDSTGVPHILEHSVLCGSDKYPVKDPFIELAKGSLNTFLNAMTYPDKTVYPVASCNDVDFKNLTDVYLDAVFHPLIYSRKEVFLQEGWHYELENEEAPLIYNGVVYNEMKGAFSSPDDVLSRYCMNSLYPDTSYATESGGDPENIPDLSYEAFLGFHKKLYHPSNSYIYFYGNCDMEERLEYLDREYLSKFDYIKVDSELLMQKPFDKMVRSTAEYSVTEEEGTEGNTYFSYNVSIGTSIDKHTCMAFDMLDYALLAAPGAPVKQALLDAGLGEEVYGSFECGIKQPYYSIVAKNTDPSREQEFLDIVRNTLSKIVKEGINKQTLEAGINSDEFKYREADYGRFPKGLMMGLGVFDTWLYDDNEAFNRLELNDSYKFLKDNINTGYFEELIQRYLLDNPHSSLVVMNPVVNLTSIRDEKTAAKLAKYKATLSKEEVKQIVKNTAELKKYQAEPTPEEDLKKIPLLKREDISKEIIPFYNDEKDIDGVKVLHHNIYTNGIGYMTLGFNINKIAKEDISYVGLLGTVFGYVSTHKHNFDELSNLVDINTGGIFPDFSTYGSRKDDNKYTRIFMVKAKALTDKFETVFDLIKEILFESEYTDYKRLKEILAETKSRTQDKLLSAGHTTAVGVCEGQMSVNGRISELTSGIEFYRFICDLYDNFESKKEEMKDKLEAVCKKLFNKENLLVSFVGDAKEYEKISPLLAEFIKAVPDEKNEICTYDFELVKKKIAFKSASQVNYVARSGNFLKGDNEYTAVLNVMKSILSYDYLWNNVRVMGGAYGCMNSYTKKGKGFFVSYRDPNCAETIKVYDGIYDYVKNFKASEREMTKYVIGTFSDIDTPLSASAKGSRSFTAYLTDTEEDDIRKERLQMLNATDEDIRKLAPIVEAILEDKYICVIGNSDKIDACSDMFDEISTI